MKLKEIKVIKGKIKLLSGLHIGGGGEDVRIGGIDNPVLKDRDGFPYIPGSSLKGKIRTLLEWYTGYVSSDGEPYWTDDDDNPIARIFGNGKSIDDYKGGPTRVSFSDCFLTHDSKKELVEKDAVTEVKAEVKIDRTSGTVLKRSGPRYMERVPAGAEFDLMITYKVFDMGDNGKKDEENFKLLLKGLKLLELDALGGSGSRGYGRVKFEIEGETGELYKKIEKELLKG